MKSQVSRVPSGGWENLARQDFPRLTSTQSPTKTIFVEKVSEDRLVRFSRPGMFLIKTSFDKGVTEWPLQHDAKTFSPAELGLEVVVVHISKIFFNLISVLGGGICLGQTKEGPRSLLSKLQEFKPASDLKSSQLLDTCYFRWLNTNRCKLTPLQFGFATARKEMTGSQLGKLAFVTCWSWLCHRNVKKPGKNERPKPQRS